MEWLTSIRIVIGLWFRTSFVAGLSYLVVWELGLGLVLRNDSMVFYYAWNFILLNLF